jgi:hypothetical protein
MSEGSEESKAAKCCANQMNNSSAGAFANCSDSSGDHGRAAADALAVAHDPPPISFFDRYLGRGACVPAKQLGQAMLPCHLVRAAMFFHAQRSRQPPPPFPPGMRLQFLPLQ